MKKLLLGLATLSLIGASTGLGVVVSLSKVSIITIKGFLNTGLVTTDDMKTTIAAIKTYEVIEIPNINNKETLIAALNASSFIDLAVVDTPNFVITYNETAGNESVILTAKDGFTFGAGKALTSVDSEVTIPGAINLGAVTTDDMKTTIAAIVVYQAITTPDDGNKDTLIAALNTTSFTGLEKGDLTNFDIAFDEAVGSETITLRAKDGFKFSTNTPLVSRINIIPGSINSGTTTITNIKNLIGSVRDYQAITNPSDEEKTRFTNDLNYKVFTGLEKEYLDKIVIIYNEVEGSESITLTAEPGFTFALGTTLVSKSGVIPGAIKTTATTTNRTDLIASIKRYEVIESPTDINKTSLINDLNWAVFTGLEKEDLDRFVISYTEDVGSETITLRAKDGFTFASGTTLVSTSDVIAVVISGRSTGPTSTGNMEYLQPEVVRWLNSSKNDEAKKRLIEVLNLRQFSDLIMVEVDNFDIENVDNTIVITAKTGFTFASGTTLISTQI